MLTAQALATEVQVPYLGISVGKIADAYRKQADEDIEKRTQQAALRTRFEEVIGVARSEAGTLPIVIFIDDLDRCRSATAVAILDAIKLFFNLPGCIFILGADRPHLEAAVQAEYKDLGITANNYLDKIIQFPFTIPADSVRDYIHSHTPYDLWACAPMLAAAAPDNPRQLKRLINSLSFLDRIARASVFSDYDNRIICALILIQNAAPDLYDHLRSTPKAWSDISSLGFSWLAFTEEFPEWLKEKLSGSVARAHLEVALRLLPASAGEADIIPYLTLRQRIEVVYSDTSQPGSTREPYLWPEPSLQETSSAEENTFVRPEVQEWLDESLEDAEVWYRQAASNGDPVGISNLAELLRGRGKDEEAELWYRNLAEEGNAS